MLNRLSPRYFQSNSRNANNANKDVLYLAKLSKHSSLINNAEEFSFVKCFYKDN